ncbi:hypothetical protein GCM10009827_019000 [Dactylosporangium maewongense]|uniref:Uncharacterized protein n=1 Tax=Dactylosporangium maewongense TaxID=634393 RepID=A0ABP4KN24_9ACTN
MYLLRTLVERVADRLHASSDAHARAQGFVVQRLPWGGRRIGHPMVGRFTAARRERLLRGDADPIDRMFLDPRQPAGRR